MDFTIPAQIHSGGLLPFISLLATPVEGTEVRLDFAALRRVSPAGLVALAAAVTGWLQHGKRVAFLNLDRCAITGYLQRMDVLKACGADLPEAFQRHEARGRFVPVKLVEHDVERTGSEMALCLAPGGDDCGHPLAALYDLAWYVFTETANNARQHSQGLGYAAAQLMRGEGLVRMAIADNGRGIRRSFLEAGLPWAEGMTDSGAILKAFESKVSSKGRPTNEGVGLTLVTGLVKQTRGWLLAVSGTGVVKIGPNGVPVAGELPGGATFPGTIVVTAFRQKSLSDFAALLQQAKITSGLLQSGRATGKFSL